MCGRCMVCAGVFVVVVVYVGVCVCGSVGSVMVVNWPSGLRRQFKALV